MMANLIPRPSFEQIALVAKPTGGKFVHKKGALQRQS